MAFAEDEGYAAGTPSVKPGQHGAQLGLPPDQGCSPASEPLAELLHRAFGFAQFRANQEAVCRAAVDGKDVLLVMPTGSGKSLCYQLPGLARGGTTLVISPLIALMEDQIAKLAELGFRVERIHSGRERMASRQVCIDYLNGRLQFLFIAPERLRVPGFPEMLAKRKPSLIAIDEAHCISQWGHDFRPDYRMLGQYLPSLRPAPVIALTATATTLVQDDIIEQLGMDHSARFIHGFRRSNIAIEVVEIAPSQRPALACELLLDEARRPAIIYTPTRKQADALAAECSGFTTAAYHAGLDAEHRKRVQEEFLAGTVDVMVATIAFGMGIDKPDVRTVIHTALPASLEAYYQEIGRAGRDGKGSRAILMHSYADRHTHDFFFERDYPDVKVLDDIFAQLRKESIEKPTLQRKVRVAAEIFEKALEKLWTHGGALIDFAENVSRGQPVWREAYLAHGEQKRAQIERVIRYTESHHCRMSALVRHFGDLADGETACGLCDFCSPADCAAQKMRPPTKGEKAIVARIIETLRNGNSKSTGKLHNELCAAINSDHRLTRDEFEEILGALARAGVVRLTEEVFEKDGREIPYRKVSMPRNAAELPDDFLMRELYQSAARKGKGKKTAKTSSKPPSKQAPGRAPDLRIETALRDWRLKEAKRRNLPAFRIFSDQTLNNLASQRPTNAQELLAISGIGIATVEKYGAQLYKLVRE